MDDPERRARMGQIGRSRVEAGLAWQHQIPKLLEAYEAAMGGSSAPRGQVTQTRTAEPTRK
jgi:hypothetical protein